MKRRGPVISLVVVLGALVLMLALNDALIPNQPAAQAPAPSARPSGAAQPIKSPEAVYVGKDETGKMAVGIAVKGGRAVGYLCDGRSVEAWLSGAATGGRVTLQQPKGPATIYADVTGTTITGIAVAGNDEFDFRIAKAAAPAGVYRKQDGDTKIGWIVLPDDSQVGIANTNGTTRPAPTLDLKTGDAERVTGDMR